VALFVSLVRELRDGAGAASEALREAA
jgi:hypothetical protein